MAMSRKHYREVVTILRAVAMPEYIRELLVQLFIDFFKRDNPRFDKELFRYEVMREDGKP